MLSIRRCFKKLLFYLVIFVILKLSFYSAKNNKEQYSYDEIENVISTQRVKITSICKDYFKMNDLTFRKLIPEMGGKSVKNLIFTSWNGGETFVEKLVNIMPGTFFHDQPLQYDEPDKMETLLDLKNFFNCNFAGPELRPYMSAIGSRKTLLKSNSRLWEYCKNMSDKNCTSPKFLERFCKLFPYQSMKLTYSRLKIIENILDDPDLDARILYFVRDPRGSLASNKKILESKKTKHNVDLGKICKQLVADYVVSKSMIIKYRERFQVVRYEDVAQNIFDASHSIISFLRLKRNTVVDNFINRMQSNGLPDAFNWKSLLTFEEIKNLQIDCKEAMDLWGYKTFQNKLQLRTGDSHEMRQNFYQRLYFY